VQASIAKLGYVPNRLARSLIQRKTRSFGVIVPDVANPFFTLIVRGIERVAWRAGYHVILCDTQGDLDRERGYLEDMVSFQVEGVLIAPVGDSSKPHLRLLTRNGVPFVLIDRSIAGFESDLVQGDSLGGAPRPRSRHSARACPRVFRRHRTCVADLSVPDRHGAAGRDLRDDGDTAASRSARQSGRAAAANSRPARRLHRPAVERRRPGSRVIYGGIEGGGTKWVCAVGDGT